MKNRHGVIHVGGAGTVCLDANLWGIKELPERGRLVQIPKFSISLGGPAAAGLSVIQALGASTHFFGPLGSDEAGDAILSLLNARGIDTSGVLRLSGEVSSSGSGVLVYQDGERSFLHAPGTNGLLTDESIDEEALSQMDAFLLAGLGILPGLDGKSMGWLMAKAKGQRVVTAVDTADGGRGLGEAIELLMPSLRFVDYLFVSEAEHQQFTGKTDPLSSVKFLLEHGALQVFLKLGEDGVLYGNDAGVLAHWPAFEVVAKNTTGCGDAFAAAAVYRVLEGASVEQSCRYAAAVSGLIAQIGEGAKSITSATQVHDFLGRAVLRKPSRVLV